MSHIRDIATCIYCARNSYLSPPVDQPNGLLPSTSTLCTAITSYWISSNNSNSQQQTTARYRQTSKLPWGMPLVTSDQQEYDS